MTFSFTRKYLKRLRRLPQHVQRRAIKTLDLLAEDPRHPSLHFKAVKPHLSGWSVRVSQDYRMVGYRSGDHITWFWIGSHADYDALLRRLS